MTEKETHPAAPGLLGSTLLSIARSQAIKRPRPASSGCIGIDDVALDGGFRYGEIASIAGESGTGKTTFAFHAVASHLLQNLESEAAIIDTKGTFSPSHLRDILALRLRNRWRERELGQSGYMYEQKRDDPRISEEESLQRATSMLDRVKVMRVFEIAGLIEAISEVGQSCEAAARMDNESPRAQGNVRKVAVADSEDESEGDNADITEDASSQAEIAADPPSLEKQPPKYVGMIVIDTIANMIGPLLSKSQVQGQALLVGLMRSLRRLTVPYNMCIIVTNSLVGVHTSTNPQHRRRPESNSSIFASVMGKPALGKTFSNLVDASILLSSIPKTRGDAENAYGGHSGTGSFATAGILEVLKDRDGTRANRWAAFDLLNGIDIKMIQLRT